MFDWVIVMGDLNVYVKEDLIFVFEDVGYSNLVNFFYGESVYFYSFGGEIGYLDYVLLSLILIEYVVDVMVWYINVDEFCVFDYNVEYKLEI